MGKATNLTINVIYFIGLAFAWEYGVTLIYFSLTSLLFVIFYWKKFKAFTVTLGEMYADWLDKIGKKMRKKVFKE